MRLRIRIDMAEVIVGCARASSFKFSHNLRTLLTFNFQKKKMRKKKALAKILIFCPNFTSSPKFMKMVYSDPIYNKLSLKTPKSTFLTKFYKIGHFRPNSWTFNFEHFFSKKIFYIKKWPI